MLCRLRRCSKDFFPSQIWLDTIRRPLLAILSEKEKGSDIIEGNSRGMQLHCAELARL